MRFLRLLFFVLHAKVRRSGRERKAAGEGISWTTTTNCPLSGPELVVARSRSRSARPQARLREWLTDITERLAEYDAEHPETPAAPFAVNLIVHRSNARLAEDLATVAEFEVPIAITSLGARADVNDAVHAYGGIVLHDVINDRFARKAVEKGADGLIAVAAGAGGHAGRLSPFALLQEIRAWFDGPVRRAGRRRGHRRRARGRGGGPPAPRVRRRTRPPACAVTRARTLLPPFDQQKRGAIVQIIETATFAAHPDAVWKVVGDVGAIAA